MKLFNTQTQDLKKEFEFKMGEILGQVQWNKTPKEKVIELTKEAYELKGEYFEYVKWDTGIMRREGYNKNKYCPLCKKYMFLYCSDECPLKDIREECCKEWRIMDEFIKYGNNFDFEGSFKIMKKRIDSL